MSLEIIDHIVISVKDLKRSTDFYSVFLGEALISELDASWKIGNTKLFLTSPYREGAKDFDKHNIGLNHFAFRVGSLDELQSYEKKLDDAKIVHSGVKVDPYGGKEFIWFDDPDQIRLEFYIR